MGMSVGYCFDLLVVVVALSYCEWYRPWTGGPWVQKEAG